MFNRLVNLFFVLAIGIVLFYACTSEREPILNREDLSIELSWIPGAEITQQQQVVTGIQWALAQLGAMLPEGSTNRIISWRGDRRFELNLLEAGFSAEALLAFRVILNRLKSSGEYAQNGAIELGRFIMLCLNSPFHYYEIVGTPKTLSEFKRMYAFNGQRAEVINSSISFVHRLIEVADATNVDEIAYIGGENGESFVNGRPFEPTDFETLDVMSNGQLRFGIYDGQGKLKEAAPLELTIAGKPSKCVWCHEVNVQPLFLTNPILANTRFLTAEQYNAQQARQMAWLTDFRSSLNTDLDFSKRQDHERTEELYEEFMEPSLERLAEEWGLSETAVSDLLRGVSTHGHPLYGRVYHRRDVDGLAPYSVIRVSDEAREPSVFEPNFF